MECKVFQKRGEEENRSASCHPSGPTTSAHGPDVCLDPTYLALWPKRVQHVVIEPNSFRKDSYLLPPLRAASRVLLRVLLRLYRLNLETTYIQLILRRIITYGTRALYGPQICSNLSTLLCDLVKLEANSSDGVDSWLGSLIKSQRLSPPCGGGAASTLTYLSPSAACGGDRLLAVRFRKRSSGWGKFLCLW
jgi:hypothetical protein